MSDWLTLRAPAKLNLSLVVGPRRADGKHEVVTVLERLELHDTVSVRRATATRVSGFEDDTLVRDALEAVTRMAEGKPRFEALIEKRIPVAAGLGGGSSDAAAALRLASEFLDTRLEPIVLDGLAASVGADVPFFLRDGVQLGTGDGTMLEPLALDRDYVVLLVLPNGASKSSTRDVYAAFDARHGQRGFDARRALLLEAVEELRVPADLARLPRNDLVSSALADELEALGAYRADVTGAGPVVYGLFADDTEARRAAVALDGRASTWITAPS